MLTSLLQFEHVIADKAYKFLCAPDSPIEHTKEALFQFLKRVGQVEDEIKAKQAQLDAEAAAASSVTAPSDPVALVEPVAESEKVVELPPQ